MFDSGEAFVPVDWAKITGDIVDRLQTVDKERQNKRNEIQTNCRQRKTKQKK